MNKKVNHEFLEIRLMCGYCNKPFITKRPNWRGHEDACDCCGSHGSITIEASCPVCYKRVEVELDSW